jgi:hypothetical protein
MEDGRKLKVRQNRFLSLAPSGRFAVLTHPNDSITVIDSLMVTSLDIQASTPAGRRTKKGQ